jgi:hypothetical protein
LIQTSKIFLRNKDKKTTSNKMPETYFFKVQQNWEESQIAFKKMKRLFCRKMICDSRFFFSNAFQKWKKKISSCCITLRRHL